MDDRSPTAKTVCPGEGRIIKWNSDRIFQRRCARNGLPMLALTTYGFVHSFPLSAAVLPCALAVYAPYCRQACLQRSVAKSQPGLFARCLWVVPSKGTITRSCQKQRVIAWPRRKFVVRSGLKEGRRGHRKALPHSLAAECQGAGLSPEQSDWPDEMIKNY